MNTKHFWVEHTGHRWANQAVSYSTADEAIAAAARSCDQAMQTTVYDCSKSNTGEVVAVFSRQGRIS